MRGRGEAVMMTLFGVAKTHGKAYCYPSQKTILALMEKYHGFEISRRTLNRDLFELEKDGFVRRTRRLTERGIRAGRFSSTLYRFTKKSFKFLYGLSKWVQGVFSVYRVPILAHNKSQTENEISNQIASNVEKVWKAVLKGGSSPSIVPELS